jgi:dTDP-4-dehydrorhamnose reductase
VNVAGSQTLATLAAERGAFLILVSTDLVFDGQAGSYHEQSIPAPLSVYGQSKLDAEQAVLASGRHAVVRASLLFGPAINGRPAFFDQQINALRNQEDCPLFHDEWRTPLSLRTAAAELARLAADPRPGVWHLGGPERMSRLEMGRRVCAFLELDDQYLVPASRLKAVASEPRPCDVSLDTSRWRSTFPVATFPDFEAELATMFAQA